MKKLILLAMLVSPSAFAYEPTSIVTTQPVRMCNYLNDWETYMSIVMTNDTVAGAKFDEEQARTKNCIGIRIGTPLYIEQTTSNAVCVRPRGLLKCYWTWPIFVLEKMEMISTRPSS